ncbi:MAG: hypothetical protein WCK29_01375 [archaeon]
MTTKLSQRQYNGFVDTLLERPAKGWKNDFSETRNVFYPDMSHRGESKYKQYSTVVRNGKLKGHRLELYFSWTEVSAHNVSSDENIREDRVTISNERIPEPYYALTIKKGRKTVYESESRNLEGTYWDHRLKDLHENIKKNRSSP